MRFMPVATRGSAKQTRSWKTCPVVDQPLSRDPSACATSHSQRPWCLPCSSPASRLAPTWSAAARIRGGVVTSTAPVLLWAPLPHLMPPGLALPARSCPGAFISALPFRGPRPRLCFRPLHTPTPQMEGRGLLAMRSLGRLLCVSSDRGHRGWCLRPENPGGQEVAPNQRLSDTL